MIAARRFRRFVSGAVRSTFALSALIAASSCGSVPSGNASVDDVVNGLCTEHNALCVPSSVKTDLGLIEDGDIRWGKFYWVAADPTGDGYIGVVCYDDVVCAEDLDACGFVILHELGHMNAGHDQTAADCWAAQRATPEQLAAGISLVCSFRDRPRCAALKECAP